TESDVPLGECYFSKNSRKALQLSYDGVSIIRLSWAIKLVGRHEAIRIAPKGAAGVGDDSRSIYEGYG
ncbi:MAG: hypothetical protein WBW85_03425, partial [Terriglobales bacterium]